MHTIQEVQRPFVVISAYFAKNTAEANRLLHRQLVNKAQADRRLTGYYANMVAVYDNTIEQAIFLLPAIELHHSQFVVLVQEYLTAVGAESALIVRGQDIASLVYRDGSEELIGYWTESTHNEALERGSFVLNIGTGRVYVVVGGRESARLGDKARQELVELTKLNNGMEGGIL